MADTVGDLKIALTFDNGKFKASKSEVEKEANTLGSKLTAGAKTLGKTLTAIAASAATAAAATVAGAIKKSFELYGEYEQLAGGVETLFGDAADSVMKNADNAFKTAQLSANQYMSTITTFAASLTQSLGGDTAKAAEYANRAVTDMADNANKMGSSMESIQAVYSSLARGIFTTLDNLKLGYGGTRGEMERLIKDASEMTDIQRELGVAVEEGNMSFANMVNAISVVQKKMGITGTSMKEASKTVQGSINSMKGAWNNFLTALGDPQGDIDKAMDDLLNSFDTFLDNAIPVLENILDKIIDYLPKLVDLIIDKLPDLIVKLLPKLIEAVVKLAFGIIKKLPEIVAAIFQALVVSIGTLVNSLAEGFGDLFGPLGEGLSNFFSGVWDGLVAGATAAWEGIKGAFAAVADWFGSVFRAAWEGVKAVFETGGRIFTGIVEGIIATFKTVVNAIIGGINTVVAIPFNAINGFLSVLKAIDIFGLKPFDWVGTIAVPQIPLLAQGGYATGASTAVIGEAGPEVVLPLSQNTGNWSGLLADALADRFNEDGNVAGGVKIENQYFNIDSRLDAENIGHVMMESIRRQAR